MKILTWKTSNFGDRLNDWIWKQYIPDLIDDNEQDLLVGIGSLLNHRLPKMPKKNIFGSGIGHGGPAIPDDSWHVHWVRGPLTAKALELDDKAVIADAAVLIRDLVRIEQKKEYAVSFICHCSACIPGTREFLIELCRESNIHFIDPNWPMERVIEDINKSERLLTEALHGSITADALRVPWYPLSRRGILDTKWHDWMLSMNMEYRPARLVFRPSWFSIERHPRFSRRTLIPLIRPVARLALTQQLAIYKRNAKWMLSSESILDEKVDAIKDRLHKLQP